MILLARANHTHTGFYRVMYKNLPHKYEIKVQVIRPQLITKLEGRFKPAQNLFERSYRLRISHLAARGFAHLDPILVEQGTEQYVTRVSPEGQVPWLI